MVPFWTSVRIWKTTTCVTHNCLYTIYAYKLTSLSKCRNFLFIGVSVYDAYGSVILCCTEIRITGWFNVPQFNLHSQTQWHSCDGSYLVSPGLVKQMLGQYLKPLHATYFYESTKASVPNLLQCWCMACIGFILTRNSPQSLTIVLNYHSQTSVGELQNALLAHLSLSGSLDTIVSFRLSLIPTKKDHSM